MKYLIVILTMTLVGCVSTKELEKRDAKIERLELALEVRTAWSYFWYQAFEACAQNNYAEPKAEEDYQVEVELKTDVEPSDKTRSASSQPMTRWTSTATCARSRVPGTRT